MTLLQSLCSTPTAPFAEQYVVRFVEAFAASLPRLKLSRDAYGNLLLLLPGRRKAGPRWVFTGHMDHPGLVAERMIDGRTVEAAFRGGVLAEYVKRAKVVFFAGDGADEIPGVVTRVERGKEARGAYPERVRVRVGNRVPAGSPGMFDQGVGRVKGRRFYSRVCDDLAGAAGALEMLEQLHGKPPAATVAVLLTRAEEEGFIGAVAASLRPTLLKKSDRIIAIETSAKQPYAPQGGGAIIRTGDRTSIFNSALTYFLSTAAEGLAKKDKEFRYQRALMAGGTCEATVYDIYGFTAASICIALGNYHNMDRGRRKIGPEYVDLGDYESMVKLFVHVARTGHTFQPGHAALKRRVEERFERLKHLLDGNGDLPQRTRSTRK